MKGLSGEEFSSAAVTILHPSWVVLVSPVELRVVAISVDELVANF